MNILNVNGKVAPVINQVPCHEDTSIAKLSTTSWKTHSGLDV